MRTNLALLALIVAIVAGAHALRHYIDHRDQVARWCLESDSSIPQAEK